MSAAASSSWDLSIKYSLVLGSGQFTVHVSSNETIGRLKEHIEYLLIGIDIPFKPNSLEIVLLDADLVVLRNEDTLEQCGIVEGSSRCHCVRAVFVDEGDYDSNLFDAFSGGMYKDPVKGSDGKVYSKEVLRKFTLGKDSKPSPYSTGSVRKDDTMSADEVTVKAIDTFRKKRIRDIVEEGIHNLPTEFGHMSTLYSTLDTLNAALPLEKRIQEEFEIPTVTVLGVENVGKSNVLKRLTGISVFPEGSLRVTSMVIEVRLRYKAVPDAPTVAHYTFNPNDPSQQPRLEMSNPVTLDELGQGKVQAIMDGILSAEADVVVNARICLNKKIVVTVTGPDLPNLNVVDLPGIYEDDRSTVALIEAYVRSHPSSIFLLVHDAHTGINGNAIWEVIPEDPSPQAIRSRTIGVLTKLDQMSVATDASYREQVSIYAKYLTGVEMDDHLIYEIGAVDIALQRGFVATMNKAIVDATGMELMKRMEEEEIKYFSMNGEELSKLLNEETLRAGIRALRKRIVDICYEDLGVSLPPATSWGHRVLQKLQVLEAEFVAEDMRLGLPPCHIPYGTKKQQEQAIAAAAAAAAAAGVVEVVGGDDDVPAPTIEKIAEDVSKAAVVSIRGKSDQIDELQYQFFETQLFKLDAVINTFNDENRSISSSELIVTVHKAIADLVNVFDQLSFADSWVDTVAESLSGDHGPANLSRFPQCIPPLRTKVREVLDDKAKEIEQTARLFLNSCGELHEDRGFKVTGPSFFTITPAAVRGKFQVRLKNDVRERVLNYMVLGAADLFSGLLQAVQSVVYDVILHDHRESCGEARWQVWNLKKLNSIAKLRFKELVSVPV